MLNLSLVTCELLGEVGEFLLQLLVLGLKILCYFFSLSLMNGFESLNLLLELLYLFLLVFQFVAEVRVLVN